MRILAGIDDTDVKDGALSTARLTRMLEDGLPPEVRFVGSLGHHLFRGIAGTTNNKASCAVLETSAAEAAEAIFRRIVEHVERHAAPGSAPGIVVAATVSASLVEFGKQASWREVTRAEAAEALQGALALGLGEGRGLIGAAAAVGLTHFGWAGRWLELGRLRPHENPIQVSALTAMGIRVVSIDRNADVPAPGDWVDTRDYLRPNLLGGEAVLLLHRTGDAEWQSVSVKVADFKKRKNYA
jgi:hypothetical protein